MKIFQETEAVISGRSRQWGLKVELETKLSIKNGSYEDKIKINKNSIYL